MGTTDKVIQENQNEQKKIENRIYGYKMAAKNLNSNTQHNISHQKWEKHFPEGIFNEIWSIIGHCKHNYIHLLK